MLGQTLYCARAMLKSRFLPTSGESAGAARPAASSAADSVPKVTRPTLPVTLAPKMGSMMRRVCTDGPQRVVAATCARQREDPGAFHEERALLSKEHREALIDLDLERVAFDLAEVGVDGRIQCNRRRQADLGAQPLVTPAVARSPSRRRFAGSVRL